MMSEAAAGDGTKGYIVDPDMMGVVIDFGSSMIKGGFAGDDAPRAVFPTIVGRPKRPGIMVGMGQKDCYVGDEAQAKQGILSLKYPLADGIVQHWNDFEKILHHSFYNELCACPEEHSMTLSFSPLVTEDHLKRLAEMLFETFNCPWCTIQNTAQMNLYANGFERGVVVDCGELSSRVCCFKERTLLKETVLKGPIGGAQISSLLSSLLEDRGYEMTSRGEKEIVRDIKQTKCVVSPKTLDQTPADETEVKYQLPDGSWLHFGAQAAYTATEILFQPSIFYEKITKSSVVYMKKYWPSLPPAWTGEKEDEDVSLGIADLIHKSITLAPMEDRAALMRNICLAGGTTMFRGFDTRVENDLRELFGAHSDFKVHCAPERKYTGWIGGSIFGSLSEVLKDENSWARLDEYNDEGAGVFVRKFGKNFAGREEEAKKKQ